MATVSFAVRDAIASEVWNAIAETHGYQATLEDGTPNPQSKKQFTEQVLKDYLKNCHHHWKRDAASKAIASESL